MINLRSFTIFILASKSSLGIDSSSELHSGTVILGLNLDDPV